MAEQALTRLAALQAVGPRWCGAEGHARAQALLREWLAATRPDALHEHAFVEPFFARDVRCVSFWARFAGTRPGRLMLATHYDTRPWADRDAAEPRAAVPGANDGGSGTALLIELATRLAADRERRSIDLVFFDAEDWHDIDGKVVSLGAERFVEALPDEELPDACIVVDMVAGAGLMLDVDVHCQEHDGSYALTLGLFQRGRALGLPAFAMKKQYPYKWIACDHLPFQRRGVPAALLMDLDYPQWHTRADTLEACALESLAQIERLLVDVIYGLDQRT